MNPYTSVSRYEQLKERMWLKHRLPSTPTCSTAHPRRAGTELCMCACTWARGCKGAWASAHGPRWEEARDRTGAEAQQRRAWEYCNGQRGRANTMRRNTMCVVLVVSGRQGQNNHIQPWCLLMGQAHCPSHCTGPQGLKLLAWA